MFLGTHEIVNTSPLNFEVINKTIDMHNFVPSTAHGIMKELYGYDPSTDLLASANNEVATVTTTKATQLPSLSRMSSLCQTAKGRAADTCMRAAFSVFTRHTERAQLRRIHRNVGF